MTTLFVACAFLGGSALLLQLVASAFGVGESGESAMPGEEGLDLFSVRALSAGVAFFGFGGLLGKATPLGLLLGIPLGLVLGFAAMFGVAWAARAMTRLEDDGTVLVERAVGSSGSVYLTIPADRDGAGKVHLTLQNRLVELQAVTAHGEPLVTGSRILVVDVITPDTVDVVPDPLPEVESFHAGA